MLAGITAVSVVLALGWYATTPRRYEYRMLYGPANLCVVDRFELGRCEAMLNALGAQGWKLIEASQVYGAMFFIRE